MTKWRYAALLPLMVVVGSCAADGGSRGTGITASVEGNVEVVQPVAVSLRPPTERPDFLAALGRLFQIVRPARARTDIQGIVVTIDGSSAQGMTDANGRFALTGVFEGPISLVFHLPDTDTMARIETDIPGGGRLTLNNVRIDAAQGEASWESQDVEFDAIVKYANCHKLTVTMLSARQNTDNLDRYTIQLDTSVVLDAMGHTAGCTDLHEGGHATVQGMVNADGTFGNATIQLED